MKNENSKTSDSNAFSIGQVFLSLGLAFVLFAITLVKKIFQFSFFNVASDIISSAFLITLILMIQPFARKFEINPIEGAKFITIFLFAVVGISFAFKNIINVQKKDELVTLASYSDVIATNIYCLIYTFLASVVFSIFLKVFSLARGKEAMIKFVLSLSFFAIMEILRRIFKDAGLFYQISLLAQVVLFMWISFKVSWIVSLSKKNKYKVLAYSFFIILLTFLLQSPIISSEAMRYYSDFLFSLVHFYFQPFLIIYFFFVFGSTIFHLPTTEIYERKVAELSTLQNIGKLVAQVPDIAEFSETAVKIAMEITGSKSGWVELILPDGVEIYGETGIDKDEVKSLINEITSAKEKLDGMNFKEKYSVVNVGGLNILIIPLIYHGKVSGFMYLAKKEKSFAEDEISISLAFADQIAIGVENSRLIQELIEKERLMREFDLARQMQMRLLPKVLPSSEKFEVSALFVPALEVGGDYYDFIVHGNGDVSIVVADVSGKGISAAFYMAEIKGIFQSIARVYPSPVEFLSRLNDIVMGQVDRKFFVTLVYAYFDSDENTVQIARAGHSPPAIVRDGNVKFLKPSGAGIGLMQTDSFRKFIKTIKLKLKKGHMLVFYSDGVIEAMNEKNEEFGYDRLKNLLNKTYQENSDDIVRSIIKEVEKHRGEANQIDDITILTVKWKK